MWFCMCKKTAETHEQYNVYFKAPAIAFTSKNQLKLMMLHMFYEHSVSYSIIAKPLINLSECMYGV